MTSDKRLVGGKRLNAEEKGAKGAKREKLRVKTPEQRGESVIKPDQKGASRLLMEAEQCQALVWTRKGALRCDWWRSTPGGARGANGGFSRWPLVYEAITRVERLPGSIVVYLGEADQNSYDRNPIRMSIY